MNVQASKDDFCIAEPKERQLTAQRYLSEEEKNTNGFQNNNKTANTYPGNLLVISIGIFLNKLIILGTLKFILQVVPKKDRISDHY